MYIVISFVISIILGFGILCIIEILGERGWLETEDETLYWMEGYYRDSETEKKKPSEKKQEIKRIEAED